MWTAAVILFGTAFLLCLPPIAGYLSTELLVSDGLVRFTGGERAAAEDALDRAQSACVEHVENLLRRKMQGRRRKVRAGILSLPG